MKHDVDSLLTQLSEIEKKRGDATLDLGGGNTYKSNAITKVGVGIDFNCQSPSPTALSNTINDATTGLNMVPSSFSGANSFNNVVTLRGDGCGFRPTPPAALQSGPLRAPVH